MSASEASRCNLVWELQLAFGIGLHHVDGRMLEAVCQLQINVALVVDGDLVRHNHKVPPHMSRHVACARWCGALSSS